MQSQLSFQMVTNMKKLLLGLAALMTLSLGACKTNSQVSAGRGIADTYVNADGYLIVVYTDGTEDIAGYDKGEQGESVYGEYEFYNEYVYPTRSYQRDYNTLPILFTA